MSSVETLFKSLACINGSFLKLNGQHMCCTSKNPGINVADAEIAFDIIRKMENSSLKSIVSNDSSNKKNYKKPNIVNKSYNSIQ